MHERRHVRGDAVDRLRRDPMFAPQRKTGLDDAVGRPARRERFVGKLGDEPAPRLTAASRSAPLTFFARSAPAIATGSTTVMACTTASSCTQSNSALCT